MVIWWNGSLSNCFITFFLIKLWFIHFILKKKLLDSLKTNYHPFLVVFQYIDAQLKIMHAWYKLREEMNIIYGIIVEGRLRKVSIYIYVKWSGWIMYSMHWKKMKWKERVYSLNLYFHLFFRFVIKYSM